MKKSPQGDFDDARCDTRTIRVSVFGRYPHLDGRCWHQPFAMMRFTRLNRLYLSPSSISLAHALASLAWLKQSQTSATSSNWRDRLA